jgi:hypothetical protein
MKLRLSILAGLLAGVAAAALLFGGIVALAPAHPAPTSAAPSLATASPAPAASGSAAAFHVDEPDMMATGLKKVLPGVNVTP